MNNRPVAIIEITKIRSADAKFVAQITATTRNFRGQETVWLLNVSPKNGVQSAFRASDRPANLYCVAPREEHVSRVPGNLADMAFTLAMEG